MTDYVSSISIDTVIDALRPVVALFLPVNSPVVRAQVNRVPMPDAPCAVLTELLQVELETSATDYLPATSKAQITGPTRVDVQIDFYGANAGEYCKAFQAAMRSLWGFDKFPANVKPLYCNDGVQSPLITGEQQYESRWTITASLQYNPSITVPQEFADVLTATVNVPADF